jgi:periplasmic divalent cation tolerance protein
MIEVHTTCPNLKEAKALAKILLEKKLAACIQLFPIESYFTWKGKKTFAKEIKVTIKTRKALCKRVCATIEKFSSMEVPELCSFSPCDVSPPFYEWLVRSCEK